MVYKMRQITELHNKHKARPIWIAGSDPTLGDYPDDFFDGKVGITLHLAALKFPNATYRYANEYDRVKHLMEKQPGFLEKENIFAWPFFNKNGEQTESLVGLERPYFLTLSPYPPRQVRGWVDWDFTRKKVVQARDALSTTFGGHGTCLHACFYVALMMGGNPINIIGCGFGSVGDGEHFGDANRVDKEMRPNVKPFSNPQRSEPMMEQTYALIGACRLEGIKVNWFKNYESARRYELVK